MKDENGLEVHSYSRLKQWRFCRQAHYYRYVDKIEPVMTARPLKIGSHIHEITALMAKSEGGEREYLEKVQKEYDNMLAEEQDYYGNMPRDLEVIMEGYKNFHEDDEEFFLYELIEAELGPVPLTEYTSLTIRPDRVATDVNSGQKFLFETKSGKSIPAADFRIWDLQTFLYIWGMRELGYKLDGIVWDHIRSKAPTIPKVLKSGELSKAKNIDTTYDIYMDEIENQGLNPDDYEEFLDTLMDKDNKFYRRVKLPIKENMLKSVIEEAKITSLEIHHLGDMKPIKNISRMTCNMCSFSSICEAELLGLDVDFVKENNFRPKAPRPEVNNGQEREDEEE